MKGGCSRGEGRLFIGIGRTYSRSELRTGD